MTKTKVYEDDDLVIFYKGDYDISKQLNVSDDITRIGIGGFFQGMDHLKTKLQLSACKLFGRRVKAYLNEEITTIKEQNDKK